MASGHPRQRSGVRRNRGQAAVFVLLTLAVVLLGGLLLFNSGTAVNEKMKLQNAADATAYSVSQLEARDLNFSAYINRAMVAQEVAIGQMIGLASWSAYLATVPDYLSFYLNPILTALSTASLGILEPLAEAIRTVINTARSVTRAIKRTLGKIVGKIAAVLSGMNFAYSAAELGMHLATAVMTIGTINQLIKKNAPGAELSPFGVFALAAHMGTYYAINPKGFVRSYSQRGKSPDQQEGMHRFAATVQESRDPFSKRRDNGWVPGKQYGWTAPIIPKIHIDVDASPAFEVEITFGLGVGRRGGTELRFRERRKRQYYSWTAADTLAVMLTAALKIKILTATLIDKDLGSNGPAFGVGGASAFKTRRGPGGRGRFPTLIGGTIPLHAYGKAARNAVAWVGTPLPQYNVPRFWSGNNVARRYPGLPRYNGFPPPDSDKLVNNPISNDLLAPNLMIGLVKKTDATSMRERDGNFLKIQNKTANDELAALAKSRVYFSRPNDLGYFKRKDDLTEKGNSFSPYWQAHLVEATFIDRVIALGIQQQVLWTPTVSMPSFLPKIDFGDLLKKAGIK